MRPPSIRILCLRERRLSSWLGLDMTSTGCSGRSIMGITATLYATFYDSISLVNFIVTALMLLRSFTLRQMSD